MPLLWYSTTVSTLLDGVLEKHDGPEPRVITADVRKILRGVIRPGDDDSGKSVGLVAERAKISTRTVYRVLQGSTDTISLDLGDRLCLACGAHLLLCRLKWPDGSITAYAVS